MKNKSHLLTGVCLILCLVTVACQSVAPYQKVYINDPEMQMGKEGIRAFQDHVQSIREGGVSADGQISGSGGCGCN